MVDSPALSLDVIAYEFRKRGVVITSLRGEYSINYLGGRSGTAHTRETLDQAIELAESMASETPAAMPAPATFCRRKRRVSKTPKAIIKRRIKAHNKRLRGWALKAQRNERSE
jgi:hypothetical protein